MTLGEVTRISREIFAINSPLVCVRVSFEVMPTGDLWVVDLDIRKRKRYTGGDEVGSGRNVAAVGSAGERGLEVVWLVTGWRLKY